MEECVFCHIIAGQIPSVRVLEDEHVIVIKDRAPKAPIHYLIIPKKHVKDIQSLQAADYNLGAYVFAAAQKLSAQVPEARDFNLVVNSGSGAGQRVFHVHVHFLAGRSLFGGAL